jgi:hypothetical protein
MALYRLDSKLRGPLRGIRSAALNVCLVSGVYFLDGFGEKGFITL